MANNNEVTWIRNIAQERLAEMSFSIMNQLSVNNIVTKPATNDQEIIIEIYFCSSSNLGESLFTFRELWETKNVDIASNAVEATNIPWNSCAGYDSPHVPVVGTIPICPKIPIIILASIKRIVKINRVRMLIL